MLTYYANAYYILCAANAIITVDICANFGIVPDAGSVASEKEERMASKFAKRHYVAIAEVLHDNKPGQDAPSSTIDNWEQCVNCMALMLHLDNAKFQIERFVTACTDGIHAKYVRSGVHGGPAMPYRSSDDWRWHP